MRTEERNRGSIHYPGNGGVMKRKCEMADRDFKTCARWKEEREGQRARANTLAAVKGEVWKVPPTFVIRNAIY